MCVGDREDILSGMKWYGSMEEILNKKGDISATYIPFATEINFPQPEGSRGYKPSKIKK